jgi:hypothetical protein
MPMQARMGEGAAHEHAVGLARQHDVVGVLAAAGEEARVFTALDGLTDETHEFMVPSSTFHLCGALLHGRTMFW